MSFYATTPLKKPSVPGSVLPWQLEEAASESRAKPLETPEATLKPDKTSAILPGGFAPSDSRSSRTKVLTYTILPSSIPLKRSHSRPFSYDLGERFFNAADRVGSLRHIND